MNHPVLVPVSPPASFIPARGQKNSASIGEQEQECGANSKGRKGKTAIMHSGVDARPGPLLPLPGTSPVPCSGRRVPWPRSGLGAALRLPNSPHGRLRFGPIPAGDLCRRAHRVRISHPAYSFFNFDDHLSSFCFIIITSFLWAQSPRITYDMYHVMPIII